ncbi:hypothetical protein PENTCL1PPCAC_19789, partial [Pristionchus entomophagus]
MTARREKWHNSELRAMVLFMHDFLKGRLDGFIRNIAEREMAKTQPSGLKAWSYLERLQHFFDEWDLGEVTHSPSSCQSKWSKYLQTRLHEVEGVPPEKILFVYHKLGIKLSRGECLRVTRQYSTYDLIWRGGLLRSFQKKVNMQVESRREEMKNAKRRREEESSEDGVVIEDSSEEEGTTEDMEVMESERSRRAGGAAPLLQHGRATPDSLVARPVRSVQPVAAASAGSRVQPMESGDYCDQPTAREKFLERMRKRSITAKKDEVRGEAAANTVRFSIDGMTVEAAADSEVSSMETRDYSKQPTAREKLLERMRKRDGEEGRAKGLLKTPQLSTRENLLERMRKSTSEGGKGRAKGLIKILSPSNKFKAVCEGR